MSATVCSTDRKHVVNSLTPIGWYHPVGWFWHRFWEPYRGTSYGTVKQQMFCPRATHPDTLNPPVTHPQPTCRWANKLFVPPAGHFVCCPAGRTFFCPAGGRSFFALPARLSFVPAGGTFLLSPPAGQNKILLCRRGGGA